MAIEMGVINSSTLENWFGTMPQEIANGMSTLIFLGKIVLLVLLIYFLILMLAKLIGMVRKSADARNLKEIRENTYETNVKLDKLIEAIETLKRKNNIKEEDKPRKKK